jgi:hypothetical protein
MIQKEEQQRKMRSRSYLNYFVKKLNTEMSSARHGKTQSVYYGLDVHDRL